jgi:flagellar motor switch/type III secretory pathway protein FliN
MSDLLSEEERSALQAPYAAADGGGHEVVRADFPSVSQLDPERATSLFNALKRWLAPFSLDLSRQLRVPCTARPPHLQTLARNLLPLAEEEAFWGLIEGSSEDYVLLTLPRGFAASVCERIFGAPLQQREERSLSPSEGSLLTGLSAGWMAALQHAWDDLTVGPCRPPEEEAVGEAAGVNWLRWTMELLCGSVEGTVSLSMAPSTALMLTGAGPMGRSSPSTPTSMVGRIGEVPMELRAVLGQASLSLDELASLRVGDVIALDRRAHDPVDLLIGQRPLCRARAGVAGQLVAIELIAEPKEEVRHER